jgi:hypothetical protein
MNTVSINLTPTPFTCLGSGIRQWDGRRAFVWLARGWHVYRELIEKY